MARIKDRARRKAALSDRKSSAAQARMKNIASLAADDRVSKKKKKGGGGKLLASAPFSVFSDRGIEDTFGANDADWAIYRTIVSTTSHPHEYTADRLT